MTSSYRMWMTYNDGMARLHATTIVSVRRGTTVALGGDGQVTLDRIVAKADAVKVRRLEDVGMDGAGVLVGFAGSAADGFSLLERFETKVRDSPANIRRAAIELAKLWRTDRVLRRLESLLAVADRATSLIISGSGDVIEPSDGVLGIGSGGAFAVAAARGLLAHSDLDPEAIVRESLGIAADLCIYTNRQLTVMGLDGEGTEARGHEGTKGGGGLAGGPVGG